MTELAANLAMPARWLMVIAIAYTLSTTVLYFLAPPASAPQGTAPRSGPAERPAPDLNAILGTNLFGAADAVDGGPVETVETAVVTRLPLELLGVFEADIADDSLAIIAERGRQAETYAIGEEVPGNATLLEVHSDHVVLRRAGVRETLHFPTSGESLASRTVYQEPAAGTGAGPTDQFFDDAFNQESPADEEPAPDDSASVGDFVNEYREQLDDDPGGALEQLGVAPVSDGAAEGYRIGDLAQSPYLSQTGLQPGDVILSVNGRPVGDLNQDRLELDNVLAQGSARLEVQRGSRRFFVTASLQ